MNDYSPKFPNIKYFRTPMMTELLRSKINEDLTLYKVFKEKKYVTRMVDSDIDFKINGGENNFFTMFIEGTTGSMKSSLGQSISQRHDSTKFQSNRICFSYNEFQEGLSKSLPKQFFILDEQTFAHGTGANRIIQGIAVLIETLRKRQNCMIIISPERKYFDEKLFSYYFETIDSALLGTCDANKNLHEVRKCKCYMNKSYVVKEAYCRAIVKQQGRYIGLYEAQIQWNNKLWQEYSVKKDDFIEKVTKQEHNQGNHEELAQTLFQDPEIANYKNKKQLSIFTQKKLSYLTSKENEIITELLHMKRKQAQESKEEIREEDL